MGSPVIKNNFAALFSRKNIFVKNIEKYIVGSSLTPPPPTDIK